MQLIEFTRIDQWICMFRNLSIMNKDDDTFETFPPPQHMYHIAWYLICLSLYLFLHVMMQDFIIGLSNWKFKCYSMIANRFIKWKIEKKSTIYWKVVSRGVLNIYNVLRQTLFVLQHKVINIINWNENLRM